jgi:hypothetical protein
MSSRTLVPVALGCALLAACSRKPADDEAAIRGRLAKKGAVQATDGTARAELIDRVERKVLENRRKILRSLEERSRTLTDPAKKAEIDRQIAEIRRFPRRAPLEPSAEEKGRP